MATSQCTVFRGLMSAPPFPVRLMFEFVFASETWSLTFGCYRCRKGPIPLDFGHWSKFMKICLPVDRP